MMIDYDYNKQVLEEVLGEVFTEVEVSLDKDFIKFYTKDNVYTMFHEQDCCEVVTLEEVHGDFEDLVGSPILKFEERTNADNPPKDADSFTWTFYEIATIKGSVTLRWLGESNGYYSENVDIIKGRREDEK